MKKTKKPKKRKKKEILPKTLICKLSQMETALAILGEKNPKEKTRQIMKAVGYKKRPIDKELKVVISE